MWAQESTKRVYGTHGRELLGALPPMRMGNFLCIHIVHFDLMVIKITVIK